MALPQVNARITKVEVPGSTDEWRDDEAEDATGAWEGELDAYFVTSLNRFQGGGDSTVFVNRSLIVSSRDPRVAWRSEMLVTFEFEGVAEVGKVLDVQRRSLRLAGMAETTKIILEPL